MTDSKIPDLAAWRKVGVPASEAARIQQLQVGVYKDTDFAGWPCLGFDLVATRALVGPNQLVLSPVEEVLVKVMLEDQVFAMTHWTGADWRVVIANKGGTALVPTWAGVLGWLAVEAVRFDPMFRFKVTAERARQAEVAAAAARRRDEFKRRALARHITKEEG